jgi:hypothetical protein
MSRGPKERLGAMLSAAHITSRWSCAASRYIECLMSDWRAAKPRSSECQWCCHRFPPNLPCALLPSLRAHTQGGEVNDLAAP